MARSSSAPRCDRSLSAVRIVGEAGRRQDAAPARVLGAAPQTPATSSSRRGPTRGGPRSATTRVRRAIVGLAALAARRRRRARLGRRHAEARRGLVEIFGATSTATRGRRCSPERAALHRRRGAALGDDARARGRAGKSGVHRSPSTTSNRVDGASRNAFADALTEPPLVPVLIVATHAPGFDPDWGGGAVRPIAGLPTSTAAELARSYGAAASGSRSGPAIATAAHRAAALHRPARPLHHRGRQRSAGAAGRPRRAPHRAPARPTRGACCRPSSVLGDDVEPATSRGSCPTKTSLATAERR